MVEKTEDLLSLAGHTALVTGASQGIGAAVVARLAKHGCRVVANFKDESCRPEWIREFPNVTALEADLSDPKAIASMFAECRVRGLEPDVLVNNAGVFPRVDAMELRCEDWDAVLSVNLRGAFLCLQEAARSMVTRDGGCIVNIASDAARLGPPRGAHYAASKAGLIAITRSFARRLGGKGIRVNAVAPGVIDTAQANLTRQDRMTKGAATPLGRVGNAEDVARVVLFLATRLSTYVTGQVLYVNGGALLA